jgi:hypothetical protein
MVGTASAHLPIRGQVNAESGQPGDQPCFPGNAGDTTAAQNKRASVHDSHLYSRTNTWT